MHRPSPPSKDARYGKPDASVTGSTHAKPPHRTQPPGSGKATRQRESRPQQRERPDRTRRGAPTRGPEARQRRTLPATTTARGQMPSHNGHLAPRTREARTTHDPPRHGRRCQGQPGPHASTPHPRPVKSRPRPHARVKERSGVRERPSPDAPHPGKRRPPRAPSWRPRSAQSHLARACAVGLVTGPQARIPRTHSQWIMGPGRTPERRSGRGWERARPRIPHTQAGGDPPGHPHAAPAARKASSQKRTLWGW